MIRRLRTMLTAALLALGALAMMGAAPAVEPLPLAQTPVPDALKAWTGWVLEGHESERCPMVAVKGRSTVCTWVSQVSLDLGKAGGSFTMKVDAFAPVDVALPSANPIQPTDVKVDGKAVPMAGVHVSGSVPSVHLEPGSHQVDGSFKWQEVPPVLQLPYPDDNFAGMVSLSWEGRKVTSPRFDGQGQRSLLLSFLSGKADDAKADKAADGDSAADAPATPADALEMMVYRKLEDEIPITLITKIDMTFAGKRREESVGPALPEGFVPVSMDASIPARLDEKGMLRVMARPGTYSITIEARLEGEATAFRMPSSKEGRWVDEEVWAFMEVPSLRQVKVTGAATVDPSQTQMPRDWRDLTAYKMDGSAELRVAQVHRGMRPSEEGEDQLKLRREMWLDFDGEGYSVRDSIEGRIARGRRLSVGDGMKLGRVVDVHGQGQTLITMSEEGEAGIEMKPGSVMLTAEGRMDGKGKPVLAWNQTFKETSVKLNLSPGWRLLAVGGAGHSNDTWINSWTLLSVFLLLLCAVATGKLLGVGAGALAFFAMLLAIPESSGEAMVWFVLALVAAEAVLKLVSKTRARGFFNVARWAARIALVIASLVFSVEQLGAGVHPVLARPSTVVGRQSSWSGSASASAKPEKSRDFGRMARKSLAVSASALAAREEEATEGEAAEEVERNMTDAAAPVANAMAPSNLMALPEDSQKNSIKSSVRTDSGVAVQTGEGLPSWSWKSHDIEFDGPADGAAAISLHMASPMAHRCASILRVILLVGLVLVLMGIGRKKKSEGEAARGDAGPSSGVSPSAGAVASVALAALASVSLLAAPADASAEPALQGGASGSALAIPSDKMLDDLRSRLLKRPACTPSCGSIRQVSLSLSAKDMRMKAEVTVHASAPTAIPLPGIDGVAFPDAVRTDGGSAIVLKDSRNTVWAYVDQGIHTIVMEGPVPQKGAFQVTMAQASARTVVAAAEGFAVAGLLPNGQVNGALIVSPAAGAGIASTEASPSDDEKSQDDALEEDESWKNSFPPLFEVTRTFTFGQRWQIRTEVSRHSSDKVSDIVDIPLVPGEQVVTEGVQMVDGKVRVSIPPGEDGFAWNSSLDTTEKLTLAAIKGKPVFERWEMNVGANWHVEYGQGVPQVYPDDGSQSGRTTLFRPLPGESLDIAITQPKAADGQNLTILSSKMINRPGARQMETVLDLEFRSSIGVQHPVKLPADARLTRVNVNGRASQARLGEDGVLSLAVTPGTTKATIIWTQPSELGTMFHAPAIDLGAKSVNVSSSVQMGSDRWILLAGGAPLGPVVRFWPLLAGMLLFAFLLARFGKAAPGFIGWALLLGGFALIEDSMGATIVTAGWLLFMAWRGRTPDLSRGKFNFRQVVAVVWTAVFIVMVFATVGLGLMGAPDMQIEGMGASASSSGATLNWFADRVSGSVLPAPWVLSIPVMAYKGVMLLWALWLAFSLVGWLRKGFHDFTQGGMWKSAPKKAGKDKDASGKSDEDKVVGTHAVAEAAGSAGDGGKAEAGGADSSKDKPGEPTPSSAAQKDGK